jgi:hypothetical protein
LQDLTVVFGELMQEQADEMASEKILKQFRVFKVPKLEASKDQLGQIANIDQLRM